MNFPSNKNLSSMVKQLTSQIDPFKWFVYNFLYQIFVTALQRANFQFLSQSNLLLVISFEKKKRKSIKKAKLFCSIQNRINRYGNKFYRKLQLKIATS